MTLLNHILIWKQRNNYHESSETLLLGNWWKLQETNNCKYLSKKEGAIDDYSVKSSLIYETIYNEYIENGGLGEEYFSLLELKRQWILKRSEWIVTGDKGIKMEAIMLNVDIEDQEAKLNELSGVSKEDALAMISENVGHLSEYDITLKQFQNYLNFYKNKR